MSIEMIWEPLFKPLIVFDVTSAPVNEKNLIDPLKKYPNCLFLHKVNNAGSIFLGRFVPEAIGDYIAGPNHVLPTARTARFSSGISTIDYMRRTSLIKCDSGALNEIAPSAIKIAENEGLDAHALSMKIRMNNFKNEK